MNNLITTASIKKRLTDAGFPYKKIKVSKQRSFIYVNLLDYSLDINKAETILKDLHTVKDISNDWDPIYMGNTVTVDYQADAPNDLIELIKYNIKDQADFSVRSYNDVQRLAIHLERLEIPLYKHLRKAHWADLILRHGGDI